MSSDLERRVQRLEDIHAINELKWQYSAYCDDHYDPDGVASLFVEDGVWEASAFGRHVGRNAIRAFMAGISSTIVWAVHGITNPSVQIAADGASAVGRWYSLVLATMTQVDDPAQFDSVVMTAAYRDELVKGAEGWRFKHLECSIHQISNLDRGWAAQRFREEPAPD
jgi:uncharacterized protein (TIGR02246 family)